jgi:hypothetical protein
VSPVLAQRSVSIYRETHYPVVGFWLLCDKLLEFIADGGEDKEVWVGPVRLEQGAVILPSGLSCPFNVRWDDVTRSFMRTTRYGETRYWGGGLTEFLCQSIARCILSDLMIKVKVELGLRPALLVHDEVVYVTHKDEAESVLQWLLNWMSQPPAWWPEVPMGAEGWIGDRYGK